MPNNKFLYYLFLILLSFSSLISSAQIRVEGFIFVDKNKNGHYDKGEKTLKNILISDGDTIVKSNKKGQFTLFADSASAIFPILPGNYTLANKGIVTRKYQQVSSKNKKYHFGLLPSIASNKFQVDIVGDVQVKNNQQFLYAQHSIFDEIANNNSDFIIFMGDLSNDSDTMLIRMRDFIEEMPLKSWNVIGNHDYNQTSPRTATLFQDLFGSDTFAFFQGNACFIGLNNVNGFRGMYTDKQIRFIRQLLLFLPSGTLPVFLQHIPLTATSNREEFFNILGDKEALVLSGHSHRLNRKVWNGKVNEWEIGASCGSWWTGEHDYLEVPLALQQCGAPRNYYKLYFDGSNYQLRYKGVGLDAHTQMDIWYKGRYKDESTIPAFSNLPDNVLIANIYAGGDSTKVLCSINDGEWQRMQHTPMTAPTVSRIIELNKQGVYPTGKSSRTPLRNRNSNHIWSIVLDNLPNGTNKIKIKAYDTFGLGEIEQNFFIHKTYR